MPDIGRRHINALAGPKYNQSGQVLDNACGLEILGRSIYEESDSSCRLAAI
jgi:hypothetical protein